MNVRSSVEERSWVREPGRGKVYWEFQVSGGPSSEGLRPNPWRGCTRVLSDKIHREGYKYQGPVRVINYVKNFCLYMD